MPFLVNLGATRLVSAHLPKIHRETVSILLPYSALADVSIFTTTIHNVGLEARQSFHPADGCPSLRQYAHGHIFDYAGFTSRAGERCEELLIFSTEIEMCPTIQFHYMLQ